MAISNYTTKIDSGKTIGEIQSILIAHDASKIMVDIEDKLPIGLTFQVKTAAGFVSFRLPANYQGVLKAMEKDPKVPRGLKTKEQALRVAWRIIRDWTEAQMAIVEAELATIDQVFFPYALMSSGQTVYQEALNNNLLSIDK